MDGVSAAASVIAVVELATKVTISCIEYCRAVSHAKRDAERLRREADDSRVVLDEVRRRIGLPDGGRLATSSQLVGALDGYQETITGVVEALDPDARKGPMSKIGIRALRWPFQSKEIVKVLNDLGRFKQNIQLALLVDQMSTISELEAKIDLSKLQAAAGATFDSYEEDRNPKCLAGTRVDLLQSITSWILDSDAPTIYWLNGMAGTGKSTISRTIAQECDANGYLGASFFFRRGEADRSNAKKFFPTLALELVRKLPNMKAAVKAAIDSDTSIMKKAISLQFDQLIFRPLSTVDDGTGMPIILVVVIDGLDECAEEDVDAILELLPRFQHLTSVRLRVILTSRPETPIRYGFEDMEKALYQDFILHEIASEVVKGDISLYLEHEFSLIRKRRSLPSGWPGKETFDQLLEIATPLFIYAATICRFIGDRRSNPRQRLSTILQSSKGQEGSSSASVQKMAQTYLPILEQLFTDLSEEEKEVVIADFQEVVGTIALLLEPLSLSVLEKLLGKDPGATNYILEQLHSVLHVPRESKEPIRFFHLSFRDFLLEEKKTTSNPFYISESQKHGDIMKACLKSMSSCLRQDICRLKSPATLRSQVSQEVIERFIPLDVKYSCEHWVDHLVEGQVGLETTAKVFNFLKEHFLHWIEVLALLGKSSEVIRMTNILQSHAQDVKYQSQSISDSDSSLRQSTLDLLEFASDAKDFVQKTAVVFHRAPLQVYVSGICFAPTDGAIRKYFAKSIPKWLCSFSHVIGIDPFIVRRALGGNVNRTLKLKMSMSKMQNQKDLKQSVTGKHGNGITALAWSPVDDWLLASAGDKVIWKWDVFTGTVMQVYSGHTGVVSALTFTKSGQLISGSRDTTIIVWDAVTGLVIRTMRAHTAEVNALAAYKAEFLASASEDGKICLWDIDSGSLMATIGPHLSIRDLYFASRHLLFSTSQDGRILTWVKRPYTNSWHQAGEDRRKAPADASTDLKYALDKRGAAARANSRGKPVRSDLPTCQTQFPLPNWHGGRKLHRRPAASCPPHKQAFVDQYGFINILNCKRQVGVIDRQISYPDTTALSFSAHGQTLAVGSRNGTIGVFNVANLPTDDEPLNSRSSKYPFIFGGRHLLSISSGGHLMAAALCDASIGLKPFHAKHFDIIARIESISQFSTFHFSPSGGLLALVYKEGVIDVFDTQRMQITSSKNFESEASALAFSPDGNYLAVATKSLRTMLWPMTGELSKDHSLVTQGKLVNDMVFSPSGRQLVMASKDGTIEIWDISACKVLKTFVGHVGSIDRIASSPDGRMLASSSNEDMRVMLWNMVAGKLVGLFDMTHPGFHLKFSAGGRCINTGTEEFELPESLIKISSEFLPDQSTQQSMYVESSWVCSKGKRYLRLPSTYHDPVVAIEGSKIAIFDPSEDHQVVTIEFDWSHAPQDDTIYPKNKFRSVKSSAGRLRQTDSFG